MPESKAFIGAKVVRAWPERNESMGLHGRDGYAVLYPDGYRSWSPKETFEACYREISEDELAIVDGDLPEGWAARNAEEH